MANFFPRSFRNIISVSAQQIRRLPRWSHRRPVSVIPADKYDNKNDAPIDTEDGKEADDIADFRGSKPKIQWKHPGRSVGENNSDGGTPKPWKSKSVKPLTIVSNKNQRSNKNETVDMLETVINEDGSFVYTKMHNNDMRINKIMAEIKSKREKEKRDLMLLEGKRLILEALNCGCKLEYILFSRMNEVEDLKFHLPKLGAKLYKMPYREMQVWSDLTTTPGIMGVFKVPDTESIVPKDPLPLTVICDNIREPNNLGAILRTCSGVGSENIILTKGCVNVWGSKVLRSSSGAHFKLRISRKMTWSEIEQQIPPNSTVFIADNNTASVQSNDENQLHNLIQSVPVIPYYGLDFKNARHIVLIIGGETEGISEEAYKIANEFGGVRLNIPLSNGLDSLNTGTALGVILFEIKRQLGNLRTNVKEALNSFGQ